MTYAQVLDWIKAAGFEQWSWVIAIFAAFVACGRWFFKRQPIAQSAHLIPAHIDNANTARGYAHIGQQIGGMGHHVTLNNHGDPALVQNLLDRLSSKDKELGVKDQLIQTQTAEIQDLRRQGIQTVVDAAQAPDANEQVRTALSGLKLGLVDNAQAVLRLMEDAAAQSAAPHHSQAARLAREQGALWLGQNVQEAYDAFARAHWHDPLHLPTLGHLVDLAKKSQSLSQAGKWADAALQRTEKLARSDPKNEGWQRDLSVSFNKVAGVLEAQGERERALGEYQKSLAISEKLAASDPKNSDWQRDLSVCYEKVAGILEAQGDRERALGEYQKSLAISEKLAASDPKNVQWQTDVVAGYWKLSIVIAEKALRLAYLRSGLLLLNQLNGRSALSTEQVSWIRDFEQQIRQLDGKM
jgi:tetratricopeptide (TPR) repeat protein